MREEVTSGVTRVEIIELGSEEEDILVRLMRRRRGLIVLISVFEDVLYCHI